ncbi:hypothetical protein EYZ11_000236 [Aspergillus tanneri]|uniref:Uncharacterized protein n=1 Tax=Aspergillus tanneri TaxID=1220188 RepID=A0A4S3JXT6_9EURO|nr:hypothetical protein EYZ11_000236 [Aspergillus tanneri]
MDLGRSSDVFSLCASYTNPEISRPMHALYQDTTDPTALLMITGYPSQELNTEADAQYAQLYLPRLPLTGKNETSFSRTLPGTSLNSVAYISNGYNYRDAFTNVAVDGTNLRVYYAAQADMIRAKWWNP